MALQAFFNGKVYTQPSSATEINSSALNPLQLGYSGIAAVIGSCVSGEPFIPQLFTSPGQLKAALGSGPAYDAARVCFTPTTQIVEGNSVRPQIVYVVRADNATQSSYTAADSNSADTIVFTSTDFGAQTNSISVQVTGGSFPVLTDPVVAPTGINPVTVVIQNSYNDSLETYSNIGLGVLFGIQYTGTGTPATMSISATSLTTTITGGPGSEELTVPFATYGTVQQVVDYINSLGLPYDITNVAPNASTFNAVDLDHFTNFDVLTDAVGVYAVTTAILSTINPVSGNVQVSLSSTTTQRPPANISTPVNLSGGSTTNQSSFNNIQAALSALTLTRINFLCGSMDADPTLTSVDAGSLFAAFVQNMQGKNECRAHLGLSANITLAVAKAYAAQLNSQMTNLWFQGPIMPNDQGVTTTYSPWMQAAMATGMQAGMPIGSSFVQKSFNVLGYSYNTSTDGFDIINNADAIILDRLSLVRFNGATSTWNCVRALSSYVSDSNSFNIEPGLQSAVNYAVYNIRQDVEQKFLGARTLFTEAGSTADSIQREVVAYGALLEAANVITKATVLVNNQKQTLPALVIDSITITDDTARLRYGIRPIGSLNFIFHTVSLNANSQVATA
jgi:hypothetical protein